MYRTVEDFIEEWTIASVGTANMIKAITDEKLDQSIVAGHSTLGWLAWHLVGAAGAFGQFAGFNVQGPGHTDPQPTSAQEISNAYEALAQAIKEEASKLTDEDMLGDVTSFTGQTKRGKLLRGMIDHQTHHRGQMTVLLRQAGLPVPPVMGPTKEMTM
ncbi:DinB family protein [Sporosarcina koreensis]|uniref:DinB family protein n=1 Tax=Sporosarcina koreensis TaxID=334735 RepID=UPI0007559220|nr:DinB family protein [Sporosarcina koreensis]